MGSGIFVGRGLELADIEHRLALARDGSGSVVLVDGDAGMGAADIQIGAQQSSVHARVTEGPERDELWQQVILSASPFFAKYEQKSGRIIPVAVLTRD